ncbi:hypothetical protein [Streptomyces sp. NPDC005732]|uniref:hypothetical protein n=1 Tax=Streptomyces sp. NPDC005732 TaxID=3157057 RepID=UPI00340A5ACD
MAAASAAGGVVAARSARRTKRQERRDDFTVVTDRMDKEIKRQGAALEEQQEQITGQGAAISWLVVDRRSLVSYIRKSGLEPPLARPIPERARPYLDSIDV